MTPHYGADYLVAYERIQQIGGVIQMPRGNKRRVPQSSPQKPTTSTCEDKRMQRCPGPLSNRPRGAPPGMNPDRMWGLVRRCADRWRRACAVPHPRRYRGRSQATSRDAVLRASAAVNASSRFCRVFLGEPNQSLRLFAWRIMPQLCGVSGTLTTRPILLRPSPIRVARCE
jgi:hypothetical protein